MRIRYFLFLFLIGLFVSPAKAAFPYWPVIQVGKPSSINSATATCVFPKNVTSGNGIITSDTWETSTSTPTFSDTRSSSWTQNLINTSNTAKIAVYSTTLGSSGAETITWSITSGAWQNVHCFEVDLTGLTLTVDVSGSAAFSGTPATVTTPSVTTTLNGDLIYTAIGGNSSVQSFILQSPGATLSTFGGADGGAQGIAIGGVKGATTETWTAGGQATGTVAIVAFKSAAGIIMTSPTTLPDGALSTAYDYTLLAQGGSGAYTWSITSGALQTGLSLNTSTGEITGTPTTGPTNSITFHVTDGTNTADLNATLKVASSMNTITFTQGTSGGTASGFAMPGNVTAGHLLILLNGQAGSGNYSVPGCVDTVGTPFKVVAIGGVTNRSTSAQGIMSISAGIIPSTAADTVSCAGVTTGTLYAAIECANCASFGGDNTLQTGYQSASSPIVSGTFTPLVAGEILVAEANSSGTGPTFAVSAPLVTSGGSNNNPAAGYQILTTGTYTPTFTFTSSCAATNACGILEAAFRPTGGTAAPGGIPSYKIFFPLP